MEQSPFIARSINVSALLIPSDTGHSITFLPLKRVIGTLASAATIIQSASLISLQAAPGNKEEALNQAVELMTQRGNISDKAAYRRQVGEREKESTTGIGEGIAIPHGKCAAVSAPGLAAMVIPGGVDFDSLDGEPVTLLFLIAAPDTEDNIHLDVLGKLSMLLMDEEFTQRLRGAGSVEEFIKIIDEADEEKAGIEERLETAGETKKEQ